MNNNYLYRQYAKMGHMLLIVSTIVLLVTILFVCQLIKKRPSSCYTTDMNGSIVELPTVTSTVLNK